MDFTLVLVPKSPDEYLLYAEKPLSGLKFVEKASQCLRRNLDTKSKFRHQTLGNVASYEISVPQSIAVESEWFDNKSKRYLPCEAGILANFLFYGAAMSSASTKRPVYPYYTDEIVLTTYVDELAFLDEWRSRGYSASMSIDPKDDNPIDIPLVPDEEDVHKPSEGDLILDDLLN